MIKQLLKLINQYTPIFLILFASLLHIIWGILLLTSNAPLFTTPISTMGGVFFHNSHFLSLVLIVAAGLAVYGVPKSPSLIGFACMIPQQTLLLLSAGGGLTAAIRGMYADGVPRPFMFIFADQMPIILLAILYTIAIIWWQKDRLQWKV